MEHPSREEIRSLVIMEIQNALGPLVSTVDKQGRLLYSLYSNGSGGPPGYLEMARAEDNKRFGELLEMMEDLKRQTKKASDFITAHGAQETQRERDRTRNAEVLAQTVKEADRKFKRYIAIWGLILAALMAMFALFDHRGAILRGLVAPVAISQSHASAVDASATETHY